MNIAQCLRAYLVKYIVLVVAATALGPPFAMAAGTATPVDGCPEPFALTSLDALGLGHLSGQSPMDINQDGLTCIMWIPDHPNDYVLIDNIVGGGGGSGGGGAGGAGA